MTHASAEPPPPAATSLRGLAASIGRHPPVKRGYVDEPVHWRYSSVRNYAGLLGLVEVVTDWA